MNGTAAPGARIRLDVGTLALNTTADASGTFSMNVPLSGQSGYLVIRARVVGSDGSVSPAAELKVRIDCNGPRVVSAAYDRIGNRVTIQFSESIDETTATVGAGNAITLTLGDGRVVGGTASVAQNIVTVTPAESLTASAFSLGVTTAVKDRIGNELIAPYTQSFAVGADQPVAGDGSGFISGEIYDATTGRPLGGVSITIDVASPAPVATTADGRGRYLARLPEGAHTITAARVGYTTVWREIIVTAGAGAIPIDIRLTRRPEASTSNGAAIALSHGGDTAVTRKVDLAVPPGALPSGKKVAVTSVGAQALVGLLPLGWSPIASAEVNVDDGGAATALPGAQLTFDVPTTAITAAAQNLTAVEYNAARDEWNVLAAVVNIGADGKATVPIARSGAYALVYPDKGASLAAPPLPVAGDVLRGVPESPAGSPPLVKRDFQLNPPIVLPSGRTVATLRIEGTGADAKFPSGTAVQAYIDEELRLADGTRLLDPPFATDLLLYRTLTGDLGVADFHLAPSPRAAEVILEMGVDRIRVFPYPGRLDRGTLIGSEGGRVPADDKVSVEIASGAVAEPLRATAASLSSSDLAAIGNFAGFRVLGGFQLTLQRATQPAPVDLDGDGDADPIDPPQLFIPARATFTVEASKLPAPSSQVILVELLDQTPFGRMARLAAPMMPVEAGQTTPAIRFTTKVIDRSILPVDGVIHEGRYLLLAAESPIAFATGTVRQGTVTGRLVADARVLASPLGVAELSRTTGIYNIPVPAKPAGPFTLAPRHTSTGDGAPYTHTVAVDPDSVTRVDLPLVAQPPRLGTVVVLKGEPPSQATLAPGATTTDVALTTNVRASFTPAIDPASVTADSIVVTDAITGAKVDGRAGADGTTAVVWTLTAGQTLRPNAAYNVAVVATIRGTNGAMLGQGATFSFETVREILNTEIHRERIRITIPDANGLSQITGLAGALPAGWQAVAVRRGRNFIQQYQATAAGDGSFSFTLGNGPAEDKVTIADLIDLRVVSTTGNLAGIFALTPFTSADGKSFVAPAGEGIRFTTPENITLDVPAGAFDEPTVISVTAATKAQFDDIEFLDRENDYVGSARVDFEGVAKKPLGLETPLPPGFETAGKTFILAEKGMSPVGPRLAMLDLMKVEGGKLVTDRDNSTGQQAVLLNPRSGLPQQSNLTLTGSKFSKYLQRIVRGGLFMTLDIKVYGVGGAVGFGAMEGLQQNYDFIWDIFWSYFIPHIHVAERGGAILPIISGRRFTVTGFDPGTGLQAVTRAYDPVPFGEPGTVAAIPSTDKNDSGPYPVFGGPFRVEMMDLDVEEVDLPSIRNFNVRLENGSVSVSPGATPLEGDVRVTLLNVSKGLKTSGTATATLQLSAETGNRIVLLIEEHRIDSALPVSVVFSEPIYVPNASDPQAVDAFLRNQIKIAYSPGPIGNTNYADITQQVKFTTDSGQRRVNVLLPSALQSEALYRITLDPAIADIVNDAPGLELGQGTVEQDGVPTPVGGGNPMELFFDVRKPAGELGSFASASNGLIRGMDLSGNVLFVAGMEAGLMAYDVSNAAALNGSAPQLARVPGSEAGISHLAVTVDRHNRVFTTAMQPASGVFRSYRVEDFIDGGEVAIVGMKLINWKIGFSQGLGLPSNTMLSDIPESIPFRIKVLLQDDEQEFVDRKAFVDGTGASETGNYPLDDIKSYTLQVGKDSEYRMQRITVENLTLDMKWSADATTGPAVFHNVIARSNDKLRLVRNRKTYAIVAHLGYGIGVYDANAIDSNGGVSPRLGSWAPNHFKEQMALTAGHIDQMFCVTNRTPDYGIVENYITTDAELRDDPNGQFYSYSVDTYRGVLDLRLSLPGTGDGDCDQRPTPNAGGLLFQTSPTGHEVPIMQALRSAVAGAAGRQPFGHFGMMARYHWKVSAAQNKTGMRGVAPNRDAQRDYILVAGSEYGLIVVDVDGAPRVAPGFPLQNENVADVIWIPGGAFSVRVYENANVAVVADRYGRVMVVDLSRIDERWDEQNQRRSGLFPTVAKALAGTPADSYGIGADDPRIVWKSQPGVHQGGAAPVLDPYTGMVFAGSIQRVKVLSAIDPRVKMKVNLGDPNGLSEVGGIVPLGIAPPQEIQNRINALPACDGSTIACKDNASLGVFQLEVSLPGDILSSLTNSNNELHLAVESERVVSAVTEQTPSGFPRSHLRRTRRDGSAENGDRAASKFKFRRIVPEALRTALKNQRGYNRFVSPWIVAIADPRASEEYEWQDASTKQKKKDAGCEECERPQFLKDKTEDDDVFELYTNGRFITVRPELKSSDTPIFQGTAYSYLGLEKRLLGRFSTIMADTVRPTEVVVAAQNPPAAGGMLQETTYLHSGELESAVADFNAGGRAGFDVIFDRVYRSRTIGGTVFGQGWDSSLLRRLRALPNGDVEYRDGAEVWRFKINGNRDGYESPKGLFLKLARTGRGWKLTDQGWRVNEFDDLGRIISESDEFYDPQTPNSGNVIRYVYDESGQLSDVTDPVQRRSSFRYWQESEAGSDGAYPGLLRQIVDWRDRKIDYKYDAATGTLIKVQLPEVASTTGGRPTLQYAYTPAGAGYTDKLELRTNLQSITDPASGNARVTFSYGTGSSRDHVVTQEWGTGENASFTYNSPTDVTTVDVLGQSRKHKLTAQPKDYVADRAHFESIVESGVPTSSTAFGQLPGTMAPGQPTTSAAERTINFSYHPEGMVDTATLAGVRRTKYNFRSLGNVAPGFVLDSVATSPEGSAGDTITQSFAYQSGPNLSTFLASVSANGKKIEAPEPSRGNKSPRSSNDSINTTQTYDAFGQLRKTSSTGGTDPGGAGGGVDIQYNDGSDSVRHQRGLVNTIDSGGLTTAIRYPSADQSVETDPRGIVRTTDYDTWGRPVHISVAGPQLTLDHRFEYDAAGRLRKHVRKQGSMDVTTSYDYDVVGRRKSVTVDNVANAGTVTTGTSYDLRNRTVITDQPGGSKTTLKLDTLGRPSSSVTTTGGFPISEFFAYDLDDNLVFRTDLLTASAAAYDAHGRMTGAKSPDNTSQIMEFDSWGRPSTIRNVDAAGASLGESTLDYADAGRLRSMSTKVDSVQTRETRYAWDGGGRTTGVSESGRASRSLFDLAGRYVSGRAGSGDELNVDTAFMQTDVSGHVGALPQSLQSREKTGSAYQKALQYNTAADVTMENAGGLEWKSTFDQAGNVTSWKSPNRPAYSYDYDSRGSVKLETLPGGATNKYDYNAAGSLTNYTDPSNEVTQTIPDQLGRPTERIYKDGTREQIVWEGQRVKSITDRQGRTQTFQYNLKGQIETITGPGDVVLDRIAYDAAGRISRWTNDDSIIEYSNYDFEGHPRVTTQSRYRNGVLVDQYTQEHTWNVHGERSSWTMPAYTGFASVQPWTRSITQDHDAMGNVIRMQRTLAGPSEASTFFEADYRNAGRPDRRTITTPAGKQIVRTYGYQEGTGLLNQMAVSANGVTLAGSSVVFDGVQKSRATLLGVSGGARLNQWQYDGRSRLQRSVLARDRESALQTEELSVADFRNAFTRTATTPVDPPSVVFRESPTGGHKIDKVERGMVVEQFTFTGGERTADGRFTYQYDVKGRLIVVTEKAAAPPIRRLLYSYDGNDRMIGRRAEYANVQNPAPGDWKPEDRPSILSADGLPADTTFVWDPVSDRLVSLFRAGASLNPGLDANGGLLRQVIHGGSDYDDPLEVTTVDVSSPAGVGRLYPLYDEAGAGSLQAILNADGRVVSRNMAAGPYGEDETVLLGPAVDKVSIEATKKSDGSLGAVEITIRATEKIADASLAGGARLAAVSAAGAVIRTSSKVPEIVEESKIQWTLTAAEWNALVDASPAIVNGQTLTPAALSIAVTNTLRAGDWGATVPFLPAPVWAVETRPVYTSATLPVEVRESLANLSQWLASIESGDDETSTLYEVPNLLALGAPRLGSGGAAQLSGDPQLLIVSAGFHAHPFQEPMTGKNYVRARWFDPQTGVWLTPDPEGYADSSNLYAFAGADPVNLRDPSGEITRSQLAFMISQLSRGEKGNFGEVALEKLLRRHGRIILEGPSSGKSVYRGGADIIAVNPTTGRIELWDNKYFTTRDTVSSVPTFTRSERKAANLARARELIRTSGLPDAADWLKAIDAGQVDVLVGNAGVLNKVRHIADDLAKQGIKLGSKALIASTGRRTGGLLVKAGKVGKFAAKVIPGVSLLLTFTTEARAADDEDRAFMDIMSSCPSCEEVPFEVQHANLIEVLGAALGEEAGGELGCAGGAAIGALLGLPTGPGAILTGAIGCIGGSIAGDYVGGVVGRDLVEAVLLYLATNEK